MLMSLLLEYNTCHISITDRFGLLLRSSNHNLKYKDLING